MVARRKTARPPKNTRRRYHANRASKHDFLADRIPRSRVRAPSLHHRRVQPSSTYLREFLLDVRIDVPVGSFERNGSNFKARGEVSTDRIDMSRLRRTIRSAPVSSIRSKLETHFPEKLSVEMFLGWTRKEICSSINCLL